MANNQEVINEISKCSLRSSCDFYMNNRECLDSECDSEPDRSEPQWKIKPSQNILREPEEISKSEDEVIVPSIWDEIMIEYEDMRLEWLTTTELSKPYEPPEPICSKLSAVQYLDIYIFPILCPALEDTLLKAKEWDCLLVQKCRFNGLDYISELLWNRNPLHPKRRQKYVNIFDIPFAVIWLYYNPRPIYPLSWLWTKEEAIIILQSYIRRYFVCKEPECSEMRQFWKVIKKDNEEERRARRLESLQQKRELFSQFLNTIIADAVFEAEWKIHGCRCIRKPCQCECKCNKWCKCCKCYKIPLHEDKSCSCSKL